MKELLYISNGQIIKFGNFDSYKNNKYYSLEEHFGIDDNTYNRIIESICMHTYVPYFYERNNIPMYCIKSEFEIVDI